MNRPISHDTDVAILVGGNHPTQAISGTCKMAPALHSSRIVTIKGWRKVSAERWSHRAILPT